MYVSRQYELRMIFRRCVYLYNTGKEWKPTLEWLAQIKK